MTTFLFFVAITFANALGTIVGLALIAAFAVLLEKRRERAFRKELEARKQKLFREFSIPPMQESPWCTEKECSLCKARPRKVKVHSDPRPSTQEAAERLTEARKQLQKAAKPWSKKHPCCVDCGTTKTPHNANGRCRKCDWKRYSKNRKKRKAA